MNAELTAKDLHPPVVSAAEAIDRLVAEHGSIRVLVAVARALVSRNRSRPRNPGDLSDHLRRDVGLWPEPKSPRYWELR